MTARSAAFLFGRFARWAVQVDRMGTMALVVVDPPEASGLAPVNLTVSGAELERVDAVLDGPAEGLAVLLEWLVDEAEVAYPPWEVIRAWEAEGRESVG